MFDHDRRFCPTVAVAAEIRRGRPMRIILDDWDENGELYLHPSVASPITAGDLRMPANKFGADDGDDDLTDWGQENVEQKERERRDALDALRALEAELRHLGTGAPDGYLVGVADRIRAAIDAAE